MAFELILAATTTESLTDVWLSLYFEIPSHLTPRGQPRVPKLRFGEPSRVERVVFELTGHDGDTVFPVGVQGAVHTDSGQVEFLLKNLWSNDALHMTALSRHFFQGNVLHADNDVRRKSDQLRCLAMCADGKSGQGCVTCVHGKITVTICC